MYGDDRALSRWNGICPLAPDTYKLYSDQLGANNNSNGSWAQTADNSLLSRGSFSIDRLQQTTPVTANANAQLIGDGITPRVVDLTFTSLEPLFLSPFHFANLSANQMGLYGVTNMNFIFNIAGLRLPSPGQYSLDVLYDGKIVSRIPLQGVQIQQPAQQG